MEKIIGHYRKCDLLTLLGTFSSFIGIILTLNKHYTIAIFCLIISGICDAFDGTLARKHKSSNEQKIYGVQLDSLSDVICFGVFPAIFTSVISNNLITYIISGFYLICGVIRLAYFNTLSATEKTSKGKFIGVPITTASIIYPLIFLVLRFTNFDLLFYVMPTVLIILGISFILKIEIPKPNVVLIFNKIFNKYVVNLVLFPLFIIIGADLYYKLNIYNLTVSIDHEIITIINNFIPFLTIYILLIILFSIFNAIFKKSKISKIILILLTLIIIAINDVKFNIMGIPLEISDINYLNPDNISMMQTATTSIGNWIIITIIKALIFLLIGFVFIKLDNKLFIKIENKLSRILISIIGIFLITGTIILVNNKPDFILKKVYQTNNDALLEINSTSLMYDDYGFFQGIILNTVGKISNVVEGYNRKKVKNILENFANEKDGSWGKANVVFILSESFSDLGNIEEISFNKNLTSNIDTYEKDDGKMVFDLLVPSYGGVSVNTEFEILTGASLNFFKTGFIPYTQYYNNINGIYVPNIIKEFNNNDYETMYLTPWGNTSYKSEYVYSLFGTDEMVYGNKLNGEEKGDYYSDKSLMKDIFNELKETSIGNYKFIMSATGQNHYPYTEDKYDYYDIEIESTTLNKEDANILRSYAQGVYDADIELNNLYEMIQTLEVPTIIVFYGDHLPYTVNSSGNNPYLTSSYLDTNDVDLNLIRKHTTKAVILSNYDIITEDIEYINASYLGAYVLNKLDLEISNYFKFIDDTRKSIPVFNRNSIYLNDSVIDIDDLDNTQIDIYKNYKYVQYNAFYDYNA